MQKKIIALAIAAAFTAPALAMADTANVTIYGQANVSYDMTKNGSTGTSANKVTSNTSRLGLKGSEDMGNGLNAVWQIETAVNFDGTANAAGSGLGDRNTYVGLASDSMGKVIAGRYDTPYRMSTRGFDQFADGIADNRNIMGGIGGVGGGFDLRSPNIIAYISPAMSGFTASAAYIAAAEGVKLATETKGSAYSLAAMYDNAGINAAFGYIATKLGGAGATANDKTSAWKIGGGYTMDAINVNAIYEKVSVNTVAMRALTGVAGDNKQTNIYISGKYSFGNDAVKLAYTQAGKTAGIAATDAKEISVGYDHNLSKRTTVYALYTQISNGTNIGYGLNGAGAAMTGPVAASGNGQKPSALSFGMKHSF